VNCERRQPHGQAVHQTLVLPARLAVHDRADIRRRPAHVEREGVLEASERRDPHRTDDACRRAGEERERGMRGRLVEGRQPARRAHDQRCRKGCLRASLCKRAQIAAQHRTEVRVDRRRGRALVLQELGGDLVRGHDVGVRVAPTELRRHGPLRLAVAKREEERDGDRVRLDLGQRVEVERDELAVGADTAPDAEATLERDDRRRDARRRRQRCARVWRAGTDASALFVTRAVRAPRRWSRASSAIVVRA
jgi:hypothetical protein